MTEQLYIDGTLMEMTAGNTAVSLVYQSPILTDIDAIVSNRSNSITMPMTGHNRAAIGMQGTQGRTSWPYTRHTAIYKRDGVQLLRGYAVLQSVSKDTFTMNLVWGNVTAFQSLFDKSLPDLMHWTESADFVKYIYTTGLNDYYSNVIDYGCGRKSPLLAVSAILSRIESECGVTGLSTAISANGWANLYVQMTKAETTEEYKAKEVAKMQMQTLTDVAPTIGSSTLGMCRLSGTEIQDIYGIQAATGIIDATNMTELDVTLPKADSSVTWALKLYAPDIYGTTYGNFYVVGVDNNNNGEILKTLSIITSSAAHSYTLTAASLSGIKTKGYAKIFFAIRCYFMSGTSEVEISASEFEFDTTGTPQWELTPEPDTCTMYPLYHNLPDMKCSDFLKNLMWLSGRFAYCKTDTEIAFCSVDSLFTSRTSAKDWTDKLKEVLEHTTILDGLCRKNWLRYAETDDVTQNHDAVIEVSDAALEDEQDLVKLDFGTIDTTNKIALFEADDDGNAELQNTTERILRSSISQARYAQYSYIMDWSYRKSQYWAKYAEMVSQPRMLRAEFVLTTADLYGLDLLVPVYLRQTGHYYAIKELTTKDKGLAEVELIEL